jgi:hypothetical protein
MSRHSPGWRQAAGVPNPRPAGAFAPLGTTHPPRQNCLPQLWGVQRCACTYGWRFGPRRSTRTPGRGSITGVSAVDCGAKSPRVGPATRPARVDLESRRSRSWNSLLTLPTLRDVFECNKSTANMGAGEVSMMSNGKYGPWRMRGTATGDLLLWLVAAATAVGFVYLLVGDDSPPSAAAPEEIAERVRPVGRVALAAPAEVAAISERDSAPAPAESGEIDTPPQGAETRAGGEARQVAEKKPTPRATEPAPPDEPQPASEPAEITQTASASAPEDTALAPSAAEPAETAQPPSAAQAEATVQGSPPTEPAPASTAGAPETTDSAAGTPATDRALPEAAAAVVSPRPAAGAEHQAAPAPAAAPGAASLPPRPGYQFPPQPVAPPPRVPLPMWPQPQVESGSVLVQPPAWQPQPTPDMIWIQRRDLPGQPYELRPAPRQSR